MKKGWISIIGGLLIGLIISYVVFDYNGWTLITTGSNGENDRSINELDFDLMTNAFGIVLIRAAAIYGGLTVISKKNQENK